MPDGARRAAKRPERDRERKSERRERRRVTARVPDKRAGRMETDKASQCLGAGFSQTH